MLADLDTWATQNLSPDGLRWPGIYVISGHRRAPVSSAFDPDAPPAEKSRHLRCPSLAVDLRVGNAPASLTPFTVWAALGSRWESQQGRWGGRFQPPDPNHFDIPPELAA